MKLPQGSEFRQATAYGIRHRLHTLVRVSNPAQWLRQYCIDASEFSVATGGALRGVSIRRLSS